MLSWFREWLVDYAPVFLTAMSGIGFASVGVLLNSGPETEGIQTFLWSWPGIVYIVAAIFIILGSLLGARQARELRSLKEKTEALEDQELDYYEHFAVELKLILKDTWGYKRTERISVYRHWGKVFQMIGRFSENSDYAEPGRAVYPADQGVIGKAWSNGTAVADLPDYSTEPDRYYEVLEDDWGIDRDTAKNLTMKSSSLAACVLYDPKGVNQVAVVVVESTEVGILRKSEVLQELQEKEGKRIYEFLEKMQLEEPNLGNAKERGF